MAEYIERESLRNSVESIDWYNVYKGKLTAGAPNTENALYKASSIYAVIDNVPSADVAPVRHGRWIEQEKYTFGVMYACSICDNLILDNGHSWNYCPNCGAKMDGGDGNGAICSKTI